MPVWLVGRCSPFRAPWVAMCLRLTFSPGVAPPRCVLSHRRALSIAAVHNDSDCRLPGTGAASAAVQMSNSLIPFSCLQGITSAGLDIPLTCRHHRDSFRFQNDDWAKEKSATSHGIPLSAAVDREMKSQENNGFKGMGQGRGNRPVQSLRRQVTLFNISKKKSQPFLADPS